jgi:ABC-type uncharacterized transport system permease subunit
VRVMLSVLVYSILSVQIVHSVQMNCTDSNYRERHSDSYVECVTVQYIECTDSVQCATEM